MDICKGLEWKTKDARKDVMISNMVDSIFVFAELEQKISYKVFRVPK